MAPPCCQPRTLHHTLQLSFNHAHTYILVTVSSLSLPFEYFLFSDKKLTKRVFVGVFFYFIYTGNLCSRKHTHFPCEEIKVQRSYLIFPASMEQQRFKLCAPHSETYWVSSYITFIKLQTLFLYQTMRNTINSLKFQ